MTRPIRVPCAKVSPAMSARPTPSQIRGARGMLGWSMGELAREARVSLSTVKRFEDGGHTHVTDESVTVIVAALARAGIAFMDDDGEGVGLRMRRV